MASIFKPAYAFYNRQYLARPILTISITNAFLAGISDTLTQKYLAPASDTEDIQDNDKIKESAYELAIDIEQTLHEPQQQAIQQGPKTFASSPTPPSDLSRTGRFMFYNFSVAPLIHTWYTILDRNFPISNTSNAAVNSISTTSQKVARTMAPGLKRMMADQALFAPLGLALLFSGLTVLEGGGVQQIREKLNNAYFSTLQANYAVWPLVQLVNFSVMPLQLRLPFVSVVGIAWNAYLSMVNSGAQRVEEKSTKEQIQVTLAKVV
ncbi:hypothetical protein BG011_004346 [Mortierella polycephala]|uniref:Uncharacterized protein n=1 Tax=Mortierella polycephala TaxID=41804 RepID=A0A9P6U2G8_9FUNG|nr:hypothetical protein BG011_004346 [Mortierella polycephala]